jgi:hypothetical protein
VRLAPTPRGCPTAGNSWANRAIPSQPAPQRAAGWVVKFSRHLLPLEREELLERNRGLSRPRARAQGSLCRALRRQVPIELRDGRRTIQAFQSSQPEAPPRKPVGYPPRSKLGTRGRVGDDRVTRAPGAPAVAPGAPRAAAIRRSGICNAPVRVTALSNAHLDISSQRSSQQLRQAGRVQLEGSLRGTICSLRLAPFDERIEVLLVGPSQLAPTVGFQRR